MGKRTSLAAEQLRALDRLSELASVRRLYLAGGAAVAFHLGHRRSKDLDLFSERTTVDFDRLEREAHAQGLAMEVVERTDVLLRFRLGAVPVDVVQYPYRLLTRPTEGPARIHVAGLLDLATMKLAAIARRGLARDFWDLYAILHAGITLPEAARGYVKRFRTNESDVYHVCRALTYFDDAARERPRPAGLSPDLWRRIERFFLAEAPKLVIGAGARRP